MDSILMNDEEIAEGVIGGIAFFITVWYFRNYLGWGRIKSAGFIFPITWVIRRVGVNVYNLLKQKNK